MPAIAAIVERLQLGENLIVGLGARHSTIELDDVAELAGKRATTRILQADKEIMVELDQVVTRHRTLRDVDLELLGGEHALALAPFPGSNKLRDDLLGFADHLKVCVRVKMRAGGNVGAADANWLAVQVGEIDQVNEIRLLVQHTADHHEIGPVEVRVRQGLGIAIDETDFPSFRQHGGYRDQAEWRRRILRADEFASFRIVPERVRNELRIDHQYAAGDS